MWRLNLTRLFPKDPTRYAGPWLATLSLALINLVGTVRSCIHIFAADSGARSIAGMSVHVAGGPNVVDLLAQWGGAQLLEALLIWLVVWRYRGWVPLMLLYVTLEQALRKYVGAIKPIVSAHTPPGAIGTNVLLPLGVVLVVISLMERATGSGTDRTP
jgi:hypothetical protein